MEGNDLKIDIENLCIVYKNKSYPLVVCNTFFKRLKGLMFTSPSASSKALLFPKCNSIHTFFVFCNFIAIFLDKNFNIVKIVENPKKNKIFFVKNASHVLEIKV